MKLRFANNATSLLAAGISAGGTTITVTTGDGALFPTLIGGDYFMCTLVQGSTIEIVQVTARTGDSMTVVRAQEGTSASAFTAGAVVSNRLTAASLDAIGGGVGEKLYSYTTLGGF